MEVHRAARKAMTRLGSRLERPDPSPDGFLSCVIIGKLPRDGESATGTNGQEWGELTTWKYHLREGTRRWQVLQHQRL